MSTAAAATFDFTSGASQQTNVAALQSGVIGLRVTGGSAVDPQADFDVSLGGGRGLGVVGTGDNRAQATQVESWGVAPEILSFSFDQVVQIDAISFAWVDGQDRARFGVQGGGSQTFKVDDLMGFHDLSRIAFGSRTLVGTEFDLAPLTWQLCLHFSSRTRCGDQHSGFRVTSLEVTALPAAVPLPLASALLASGLGGLFFLSRRRRSA